MATYSSRFSSTKRGRRRAVRFYVFTKRHWRRFLFVLLLAAFASIVLWQQKDDEVGTHGGRVLETQDDLSVPAFATGTAVSATDGQSDSLDEDTFGPDETTELAPPLRTAGVAPVVARAHPFDDLKLERERTRSRQAETLQQVLQDPRASAEERDGARHRLELLWTRALKETELEHLLAAEGFSGVVLLSDVDAHVVVDGILDGSTAARIGELVASVGGVRRESISIVDSLSSGG